MKGWLVCLLLWSLAAPGGEPAPVEVGRSKAVTCLACHGVHGQSTTPKWPHLAGLDAAYLEKQLREYKVRDRDHGLMARMTDPLSHQDMADIAAWMATLPAPAAPTADDSRGEQVYRKGLPERGIPPCAACHGPAGEGFPALVIPALAGQRGEYIRVQVLAFRKGIRTNDPGGAMTAAVKGLKYPEIQAVADWLSSGEP